MRRVVLASASPRRRELMGLLFPDFKVVVSHADENITMPIPPEIIASELAARKARAAAKLAGDALIVGALHGSGRIEIAQLFPVEEHAAGAAGLSYSITHTGDRTNHGHPGVGGDAVALSIHTEEQRTVTGEGD